MSNPISSREGKVAKIFTYHFGDHVLRNTLIDGDIWWGAEDLLTLTGRMDLSDTPGMEECGTMAVTGRSDDGVETLEVVDMTGLERMMLASKTLGIKKLRDWIVETVIPATKDKPVARRSSGIRPQPVKASERAPQSTEVEEIEDMTTMQNNVSTAVIPQVFTHDDFGQVRTVVIKDKPYAVANDVAEILKYARPRDAIASHCKGAVTWRLLSNGGEQLTKVIPEGDIWRLVVKAADQSKSKEIREIAKKFESWIFDDVLPSIRQHGMYMTSSIMEQVVGDPQAFADLAAAYAAAHKENLRHLKKIEEDKPKVAFADCVTMSSVAIPVGDLAKLLHQNGCNIGRNRLYEWLRENDYVIKSGASKNMPLQRWMEAGLFVIHEATFYNGSEWVPTCTTMVTGKGQLYFINLFCGKEVAV